MPDFPIRVKVDPKDAQRGSRKVKAELQGIENKADSMRKTLGRAFQFAAIVGGIIVLKNLADAYTNIQNRLGTVTNSYEEQIAVTERLFKISNATRSSYEATAEVYARTALAVKEMGRTQEETLRFTESLNQAVILSGASATEAQAGLIQLSQGLASGALRGDELRSVLEQLPAVADVIAKGLGVTRGELRLLGGEGKITADIVLDAFAAAREELTERFAKTVPTIGQAFVVMRNKILEALGALDATTGVSVFLSGAIIDLANNMDMLVRIIGALAIVIGVNLVQKAIGATITAIRVLGVAIVANPIGALLTVVLSISAALITFSDRIKLSSDGLVTLKDYGVATFVVMKEKLMPLLIAIEEGFGHAVETVQSLLQGLGWTFGDVLNVLKVFVNSFIGSFVGLYKAFAVIFTRMKTIVSDFLGKGVISFENYGMEVGRAFISGFAQDFVGDFVGLLSPAFSEIGDKARQLANERLAGEKKAKEAREAAQRSLTVGGGGVDVGDSRQAVQDVLNDLAKQAELLGLTNQERQIQNDLIKIQNELQKVNITLSENETQIIEERLRGLQSLQLQADLLETINSRTTEFMNTQEALNVLLSQGRISLDEYNQALAQTQIGSDISGLKDALFEETASVNEQLQTQLAERQALIDEAFEVRLISEQEYLNLSVQANLAYNAAILENEANRQKLLLRQASSVFEALADITKTFAGEQSKTYKALFTLSKAFAIAETGISIVQGIAKSAALGWPANIAAIAATVAQTAGLIGQLNEITYAGGYQMGGSFKVQGQGGPDSQMIAFKATPGEQVNVETPAQQKAKAGGFPTESKGPDLNIINVVDPSIVEDFLTSVEGERVLVNSIGNNRETINATLQQ
jgi:tape measure domain-containing protein